MSFVDAYSSRLPTPADVRQWGMELEQVKKDEARMKARHAAEERAMRERRARLEKLVAAGSAFVEALPEATELAAVEQPTRSEPEATKTPSPNLPRPAVDQSAGKRGGQRRNPAGTWTGTILRIVGSAERGITHTELKEEVAKTHLGETLKRTDKAFYGGIGKLEKKKKIIKHNGRLYSPAAYRRFMKDVSEGLVIDKPVRVTTNVSSDNKIAVLRLMSGRPQGASTAHIVAYLLNTPPSDLTITTNRNSIYNLLARMVSKGELTKRGGRYYLPASKNEAPSESSEGASGITGEVGASPIESRGQRSLLG